MACYRDLECGSRSYRFRMPLAILEHTKAAAAAAALQTLPRSSLAKSLPYFAARPPARMKATMSSDTASADGRWRYIMWPPG